MELKKEQNGKSEHEREREQTYIANQKNGETKTEQMEVNERSKQAINVRAVKGNKKVELKVKVIGKGVGSD